MKLAVTVLLIIGGFPQAYAKNYYFSSSTGNDLMTPIQAQNMKMPWKSLDKLNSIFTSLQGGDSILLKRGDVFYGNINITKSGTAKDPIVISAYNVGPQPIISAFETLAIWSFKGHGIYESSTRLSDSIINILTINGKEFAMGRFPNANDSRKGWLTISSHVENRSITDNSLSPVPDWSGGEVIIRKNHYIIDRSKIISHAGNTINYASGTAYSPTDGFGYFIQDQMATLDQIGEWYYNRESNLISVYFGNNNPSAYKIRAGNISNLINVQKQENIVVKNISFEGSNQKSIYLSDTKNVSIENCNFNFSGSDAINGYKSKNVLIQNCKINYSNNNAIDLLGLCDEVSIKNNIITNSGLFPGMAGNSSHSFSGININGDNNLIEYNEIDSTGYIAIRFAGSSTIIKNNFINYFCLTKDDGGGIYTGNNDGHNIRNDQVIDGNIILNGVGASEGTVSSNKQTSGIYLDDNAANIKVINNTVSYAGKAGIFLHNSHDIYLSNNTCYSNVAQFIAQKDAASKWLVRNDTIIRNIFFTNNGAQLAASFLTIGDDINQFGKIDSNYYNSISDQSVAISTSYVDPVLGKINKLYSLEGWKSKYKRDATSKNFPLKLNTAAVHLNSENKFLAESFKNNLGIQPTQSKIEWQNDGGLNGGYVKVSSLPNAPSSYITIPIGAIHSGKDYVLKFSMKGQEDSDKTVGVFLRSKGAPYTILAPVVYQIIPLERHDYEIVFSDPQEHPEALLVFLLKDPSSTYFLNNVKLFEVNKAGTNIDQQILFEYNPSVSIKKVFLNGTYVDLKNRSYTKSFTLQPYASAILIKQN
ncbi:MAG TPA: right-handed parallel beta-helix repeat-containing protein [Chitinophagaceae bacterium]|nr:right-handed parallel beta-helix repeat-containing protein [Chitinophagaceae bacterium]